MSPDIPLRGHYNVGRGLDAIREGEEQGQRVYYYLVESKREGNKVRQRIIRYLGTKPPTKEELENILRRLNHEKKRTSTT